MRLLLDQDVFEKTALFLIGLGHDVVRVAEIGMSQASDEDNLRKAVETDRIFVTRDRDYGNLVFVMEIWTGVLYLRILPSNLNMVHAELERVLNQYKEAELRSAFVVIGAGRHRFRKI